MQFATATAAEAAEIIRDMCLWSGDGFANVLVVDHYPKFTSEVFRAFVKLVPHCGLRVPQQHQGGAGERRHR